MNTLNICAIVFAALSSNNTCSYMVFGEELGHYSCEATPRDIYESCCYMGQDLKCYSEDEYPSYKVSSPRPGVLKVTATYKGCIFVKLYSDTIEGEDVDTSYGRMDGPMARVLAAYGDIEAAATLVALERIYSQDGQGTSAKVYTDTNHYTLFTCQGGGTLENASYIQDEAWWVTDRLTSCGSTNINSEDAYRILVAASLAKLDYNWIRSEMDRSIYISSGHKNYLYKVAAGYIQAV